MGTKWELWPGPTWPTKNCWLQTTLWISWGFHRIRWEKMGKIVTPFQTLYFNGSFMVKTMDFRWFSVKSFPKLIFHPKAATRSAARKTPALVWATALPAWWIVGSSTAGSGSFRDPKGQEFARISMFFSCFFYWRSPDGELSCGLTCPLYMFMVFVHICACVGHKETFIGAWWARPPTLGPGRKPSGAFKDNVQWDLMVAGRRVLQTCTSDGYTRALDVDGGWWICLEPVVVGKNAWEKKSHIMEINGIQWFYCFVFLKGEEVFLGHEFEVFWNTP